jgi:hypothetical protein
MSRYLLIFLKKRVSEIKRPPLWKGLDPPLTYKNEINILSRTETRGNTAYVDDLIINEKYKYKLSLENIRAKEVLIRISA